MIYLKQQTVSLRKVVIKAFQKSQNRDRENFLWRATTNHIWTFFSSLFCLLHYPQRIAQDVVILFFKLFPDLIIQNISDQVAGEGYKYSSSDDANLHLLPQYNGALFFLFSLQMSVLGFKDWLNDSEDNWKCSKVFICTVQSKPKLVVILQN